MSDLFSEALKDSKKLREVAEQDAKNRIVEALTPYIKEMIAKEASAPTDFFFEQDEDLEGEEEQQQAAAPQPPTQPVEPQGTQTAMPTTAPDTTTDPTGELGAGLGDQGLEAPLSPEGEELADASMPDEEGKITVDFEDLFVDSGSITLDQDELDKVKTAPAAGAEGDAAGLDTEVPVDQDAVATPVAPAAPETAEAQPQPAEEEELELPAEAITYKEYQRAYSNIAERVDRMFFTESVSDISRETLKQRLFDLLEAVDQMREAGLINKKQARLQENKLEFLFIKLKEAGLRNSYSKENQYKDTAMKSLKEFAAKLFEEDENLAQDSVHTGESGLNVDDEYSEHAAEVSGVDPELGDREDIEVAQEGKEASSDASLAEEMKGGTAGSVDADAISPDGGEKPWNEGEPVIDEEDQDDHVTKSMNENSADANTDANDDVAEGAAGFGDTDEDPVVSYEVDADELAEAVRDIKKESIRKKMQKLREASDGEEAESWEDADPEGGKDPSHKNLKEGMDMELTEEGDMMDMEGEEDLADLVLSVDLPPEVEQELAELGLDDDDLDVDVELNVAGGEDMGDMGDDEEVEIVDDEGGADVDVAPAAEEEEVLLTDEGDMVESVNENKLRHAMRKNKLLEKKLARAAKLLEEKDNQMSELKKQLVETNLFTAKAVYYSKFLQRSLNEKALNKKVLQQIVEHLDKGKTVAETKAIYKKIEQKLNEHATASRKLDGSSSKVTKPGSANLTEGKAPQAGRNPDAQTPERWKLLAGIK